MKYGGNLRTVYVGVCYFRENCPAQGVNKS
jgi:hypothetical protein